jgi:hypothetical protein
MGFVFRFRSPTMGDLSATNIAAIRVLHNLRSTSLQ